MSNGEYYKDNLSKILCLGCAKQAGLGKINQPKINNSGETLKCDVCSEKIEHRIMSWLEAMGRARTPMAFNDEFQSTQGRHPLRRHPNGGRVTWSGVPNHYNLTNMLTHERREQLSEDQIEVAMEAPSISTSNWHPD